MVEGELVQIAFDSVTLEGMLNIPKGAQGVVIFAHGSGSNRHSPRNNFVARIIRDAGMGILLFDLLTEEEDGTYETRFDIDLLTRRLKGATQWLNNQEEAKNLKVGYFGSSTGAAAALIAAAEQGDLVAAVVSRGGRTDLADGVLEKVRAPTLLIVGGNDTQVLGLNRESFKHLKAEKELSIIPGAGHLFEESNALEEVVRRAADWFKKHLS